MSQNTFEDQTAQTIPSLLQSKPQRKARWRGKRSLSIVLLGVGAAIIVATGVVLAIVLTPRGSTASNANTTSSQTRTSKQANSNCGQSLPPSYWSTLFQQTAQGLHESVAQVKAQIKGGQSIQDVAHAQGISDQQLLSIETNALQAANNQMVTLKCTTQALASANVQSYVSRGAQDLNSRFTYWFATQ